MYNAFAKDQEAFIIHTINCIVTVNVPILLKRVVSLLTVCTIAPYN